MPGPVPAQEQEAAQREHVRPDVADVAQVQDGQVVGDEQDQHHVHDQVHAHGPGGHVVAVQVEQLLDRHIVAGDPVQRP